MGWDPTVESTTAEDLVSAVMRITHIKTTRESQRGLLLSDQSNPPQRPSQDPCTELYGIFYYGDVIFCHDLLPQTSPDLEQVRCPT